MNKLIIFPLLLFMLSGCSAINLLIDNKAAAYAASKGNTSADAKAIDVDSPVGTTEDTEKNQPKGKYLEYKHYYTKEGFEESGRRGTYSLDPHIWVYTSEFAKRFGMPKEWIDDGLQGAQAIAFRYDLDVYSAKCGYFGDLEECRPSTACVVDMYIDDDANIPWNTETKFDSRYGYKSFTKLAGNAVEHRDKIGYLNHRRARYPNYCSKKTGKFCRDCKQDELELCKIRPYEYEMGVDNIGINHEDGSSGSLNTFEYDRDIYKGLVYISGSATCNFIKKRKVQILFNNYVLKENGSIDIRATTAVYMARDIFAHKIDIPDSYMKRLERYSKEAYEPDSLFNSLKKNLSKKQPNAQ